MTATLVQSDAPAWSDWITNFDGVYQSFMDNYNALISLQPWVASSHPEELDTVNQLLSDAQDHIATLTKLKETRDYVASWLTWLQTGINTGVDFVETNAAAAYNAVMGYLGLSGFGSLGIAPIIVAVSVVAAAAALVTISYWIQRAYTEAQRLNALQSQEALGLTPDQAAAAVAAALGPPPGAGSPNDNLLGIPWTWIITGAVLVAVGPKLIELVEQRRRPRVAA